MLSSTVNALMGIGNYSATSFNMKLVYWPLVVVLLHFVQRRREWAGRSPPRPSILVVPSVTAHPSTASVPITVSCCITVCCSVARWRVNITDSKVKGGKTIYTSMSPDVVISVDCACATTNRTKIVATRANRAKIPLADIIVCWWLTETTILT